MAELTARAAPELLHYRPWHGAFRGPAAAVWPIARTSLALLLRRRLFWVLYGLGLFLFLLFFFGQYLAAYPDTLSGGRDGSLRQFLYKSVTFLNGTAETYRIFILWQCNIVMVVLALAGSLLIGNDLRFGSLSFYLSKPIGRRHYLLGKGLAVAAAINLLTTLPALVLYFEFAALYDWRYLINEAALLLGVLAYGAILTIVLSLLLLASAMWLRRTVPLIMLWTTLFVFCRRLSIAVVDLLRWDPRWRLVDLWNDLFLTGNACLRAAPPPGQPAWQEAALVLTGVSVLCLSYLMYRIRAVEIVP
jgi:ABC-type transport system involved in multi-copper enzyme maturation permease subunit